jgi:cytochrome c-type biogenesis protein CcsB
MARLILPAVLVLELIALVADIVIITTRTTRAPRVRAPARAGAGRRADDPSSAASEATADTGGAAPSATAAVTAKPKVGLGAYATGATIVALALLTVYLVARTIETGHGPFANGHEFAVAFVWGVLAAYLVVERLTRLRLLAVAVLPVAACLTLYAISLGADVQPLAPALQNNLLLTLHVGFAILAYGAACVSFAAAALYLLRPRLKLITIKPETLDDLGHRAAVVTFPLLTIMIVLGALWADTAWGSYWSWDPKETAALVTWLIYAAFLHGRVVRGWRGRKAAWLLVLGFAAVLFAYFGNHFLGGLHSYGG